MTPSQTATGDKELNVQNLADSLFRSSSHRAINKAEELFNTLRNNCQDATSIQLDEFAQLAEKQTMEWIEAGWTETKARLSKYVQSWLRSEAKDPPREGSHSSGGKVQRKRSLQNPASHPERPEDTLKRKRPNPRRANKYFCASKEKSSEVVCPVSRHSSLQEHKKCPGSFSEIKALRSHIRNELLAHICPECSERFKNSTEKNNHQDGCRKRKEDERARNFIDESEREDCKVLMERGVSIKVMEEVVKRLCERRRAGESDSAGNCSCKLPVAETIEQSSHWPYQNHPAFGTYGQAHPINFGLPLTPDSISSETSRFPGTNSQICTPSFTRQQSSDVENLAHQHSFSSSSLVDSQYENSGLYASTTIAANSGSPSTQALPSTPSAPDNLGSGNEFYHDWTRFLDSSTPSLGLEQELESPFTAAAISSLPMHIALNNGQVEQQIRFPSALESARLLEDSLGAVQSEGAHPVHPVTGPPPQDSQAYPPHTRPFAHVNNRSDPLLFGNSHPHGSGFTSGVRNPFGQGPEIRLVYCIEYRTANIDAILGHYQKLNRASKLDKARQKLNSLNSEWLKVRLGVEYRDLSESDTLQHGCRRRKVTFEDREVESASSSSDTNAVLLSDTTDTTRDQFNGAKPAFFCFSRSSPFFSDINLWSLRERGHCFGRSENLALLLVNAIFWIMYYAIVLAMKWMPAKEF